MNRTIGATRAVRLTGGLFAVALAATALVGCGSELNPLAGPTAKEKLLATVPDGAEGPFRFTNKDSTGELTGSVDGAAKAAELAISTKDPEHGFTTKVAFLVIGDDVWSKITFSDTEGLTGLPKLPKKWMAIDRAKLDDGESVPRYEGVDIGNTGPLIQAATSVEDQGSGQYSGSIDLTSGEAAEVLEADQMAALGEAAKQVPFTATVDGDGNLTSLTLDVPAAGDTKAYKYVVTYEDYGSAPKLTAPEGDEAQPAPAAAYEMFNA